jgi:multimeric flavodoxin WrbA
VKELRMKILGLSFSPHENGNTMILLGEALKGAKQEGAEVELYSVSDKTIKPCDGCRACSKTGICHIKDDMQGLYDRLLESDGIIFGTPVYFYSMTAQAKAVIDRTIAFNRPERSLANKVGGVIVVAGSQGNVDVLKEFYFYMATRQILAANFVSAYPGNDLRKMENCVKAAFDLGRQISKIAAIQFRYPGEFPRSYFAFGTEATAKL